MVPLVSFQSPAPQGTETQPGNETKLFYTQAGYESRAVLVAILN